MLKSNKIQEKFSESSVKHELYSRKINVIFTSFDDYELSLKQYFTLCIYDIML